MAREHLAHPGAVHALAQAIQHDEVHTRIVARAASGDGSGRYPAPDDPC